MKQRVEKFNVIESTSTKLCVELTSTLRLIGHRHSNRLSGASVWETRIEKFGKWKIFDNPFDRNDFHIEETWGCIKANAFRGIVIAKRWNYKQDIIETLNKIN